MKIDIVLQINNLRMLKGVFLSLYKILFEEKKPVSIHIIYFTQQKQIRLLIDAESCKTILAIDPRVSVSDKSVLKEDTEIMVSQFLEPEMLMKSICQIVDKEGSGDVTLSLFKDREFRSLNFSNSSNKYRNQIEKPQYDPPRILNHPWLNGCHSDQQKKVVFDIESDQLLCLLRQMYRHKETFAKQKMIYLEFNFIEGKVEACLEKMRHQTSGEISDVDFKHLKYRGNYRYLIFPQYAGKMYELFMAKSSGRKFIINTQNQLILNYYHNGVFESQILINQWAKCEGFEPAERGMRANELKLEY